MKKKFMQLVSSFVIKPTLVLGFIQIIQLIRCPVNHSKHVEVTSLLAAIRIKFRVGEFGTGAPQLFTTSSKVASTGNGDVWDRYGWRLRLMVSRRFIWVSCFFG